jgi:hypothetical protein
MRCLAVLDIVVYGAAWIAISDRSEVVNLD